MASPRDVVVVSGARSPFVRAGTTFKDVPAAELGRVASREALARGEFAAKDIDEVLFGCVAQPADSPNIARVIALRSGLRVETPAVTVSRNCASGLEAVTQGFEAIRHGRADTVLVGGTESMSRIPLQYPLSFGWKLASLLRAKNIAEKFGGLLSFRLRDLKPEVTIEIGLTDPVCGEIMGLTAERISRQFGVTRTQMDEYALESHRRAIASSKQLQDEIQPLAIPPTLGEIVTEDIGPRATVNIDKLKKMRPYFDRHYGAVTIGNSCGLTDGAAALVLMSAEKAKAEGRSILGRIIGYAYRGLAPERMGLGPVHAAAPALASAGLKLSDLSNVEINEAFAGQVLACQRAFESKQYCQSIGLATALGELPSEKLNNYGGAIALGHPVGATGARLVLTLLHQLRCAGGGLGLAALCIGGGQGGAIILEGSAS